MYSEEGSGSAGFSFFSPSLNKQLMYFQTLDTKSQHTINENECWFVEYCWRSCACLCDFYGYCDHQHLAKFRTNSDERYLQVMALYLVEK